jgi:hypothetical protein
MGERHEQQRGAIGRGLMHGLPADGAARARAILHDDRHAQHGAGFFGEQSRHDVDAAAGGERHDHSDRFVGECALLCKSGRGAKRN